MKTSERQHLKRNEVALSVERVMELAAARRKQVVYSAIAVLVVAVVLGGFFGWRAYRNSKAHELLAGALAVTTAPVVPPGGTATAPAPANSFTTERARAEEAIKRLLAAADAYPSTDAGITARYRAAGLLASLGRTEEAQQQFSRVADLAGSSIYGRMARLGVAEMQLRAGKKEEAIAAFRDLAASADADLPLDGILMQLGRAYALAGRRAEAEQTYDRVVREFPESLYADEARREIETLKGGAQERAS